METIKYVILFTAYDEWATMISENEKMRSDYSCVSLKGNPQRVREVSGFMLFDGCNCNSCKALSQGATLSEWSSLFMVNIAQQPVLMSGGGGS